MLVDLNNVRGDVNRIGRQVIRGGNLIIPGEPKTVVNCKIDLRATPLAKAPVPMKFNFVPHVIISQ